MQAALGFTITLAAGGVYVLDRDGVGMHLLAHLVAVPHDVGAGDSFASVLILALAARGDLREAVQIALDAAGIAVSKPGTAIVSFQKAQKSQVGPACCIHLLATFLVAYVSSSHSMVQARLFCVQLFRLIARLIIVVLT